MIPEDAIDAALGKLSEAPLVREFMRAALEAAAPFIEQAAYDRGFDDGHLAGQESMETE